MFRVRETYPDGWSEPEWLWKFMNDLPSDWSKPWSWFWAGVTCTIAPFLLPLEEGEPYFWTAGFYTQSLVLTIGVIGWLLTSVGCEDRWEKEAGEKWLKEKARADSYRRDWTAEDLKEVTNNALWKRNWLENWADEIQAARSKRFWWRMWKDQRGEIRRPSFSASPKEEYLHLLANEIQQRMRGIR